MWFYKQSTGELSQDGQYVATGYSGHAEGRNDPAMEDKADLGPLPRGLYVIGTPFDTTTHGPHVMRLSPCAGTDEHGRAGFLMHGDNTRHDASLGCVIMDRVTRDKVSASGDKNLEVIA